MFYSVTEKSSLVMDKPERKEQRFFLVAGEKKKRACRSLSDTRHPLDKLWTNSRHVQALLSAHRLEGMARAEQLESDPASS